LIIAHSACLASAACLLQSSFTVHAPLLPTSASLLTPCLIPLDKLPKFSFCLVFILEPNVHLCSVVEIHVPCTSCCHCYADPVFAVLQSAKKRKKKSAGGEETENGVAAAAEPVQPSQTLTAESYTPPDPGPYPQDKPPENPVRFTPVQVHACTHICASLFAPLMQSLPMY